MARRPRQPRYGTTDNPNQQPSEYVPYAPDIQPDVAVTDEMRGRKPVGYPPAGNYTLATYDSRLPQTIDFDTELAVETDAPNGISVVEFIVPEGRTLVIKRISITLDKRNDVNGQQPNVSLSGYLPDVNAGNNVIPRWSVLLNGRPVENYSDVSLLDLTLNEHAFESFILVRGGTNVGLRMIFDQGGDNPTYAAIWRVYGNELLSKGSDITQEPTNLDALPVKAGFFGRLAAALENISKVLSR